MRSLLSLVLLATTSLVSATPLEARDTSVVDVGNAKYQGILDSTTDVTNFLGIRYAAAPTGRLRFSAPTAPPTLTGVQNASAIPFQCHQSPGGAAATSPWRPKAVSRGLEKRELEESEDCLFLNVHVPGNVDATKKLPVVVWLHGGGYDFGSAENYDGSQLVIDASHGAVAVVLQYRLGLFGFLAGSQVKAGGALNAGLLDQEFALKWVQSNIAKFGGDPSKVTIWGQSAGAGSVLQQMVARGGKTSPPLFRAGMISSPYLHSQYQYNDVIPEKLYSQVVNQSKCSGASDTLGCLRSADVSVLAAANSAINSAGFLNTFSFVPVVDGTLITQSVKKSLAEKKTNAKALLSVNNAHEGIIFVNQNITFTAGQYAQQIFPKLSDTQAQGVDKAYASFPSNYEKAKALIADSTLICPSIWAANSFSGGTVYKAQFAIAPADHLQDLSYYFNGLVENPNVPPVFTEGHFQTTFAQSFLSFATSLNPNDKLDASTSVLPQWTKYSTSNHAEMYFGQTSDDKADIRLSTVDGGLLDRCAFWDSVNSATAQ